MMAPTAVPTIMPTERPRRPFHWRALAAAGAVFAAPRGDGAVAWHYAAGIAAERDTLQRLGVADLSPLPRAGVKGRDAPAWLAERGLTLGEPSNRAYRQPDGTLAAKLAPTEALLLPDPAAPAWMDPIADAVPDDGRLCFAVPRQDASLWFRITGAAADRMFAKLCGVDLRPAAFADLSVAQTSIARMSGIVIRDDLTFAGRPVLAYHLLADSASAAYLWRCLLDAAAEFDGAPVGLAALIER